MKMIEFNSNSILNGGLKMKTGDRVQVRDKGGFWTTAIYLFTTKYGKHICQRPGEWDSGNISLESWDEINPHPEPKPESRRPVKS